MNGVNNPAATPELMALEVRLRAQLANGEIYPAWLSRSARMGLAGRATQYMGISADISGGRGSVNRPVRAPHRVWPPDKGAANDSERGFLELNPPAFGHPPCQGDSQKGGPPGRPYRKLR
jgi:hypothetical protein